MSRLAQEENALNLSQGFPDFACDPHLLDLVNQAMRSGENQYAPMAGLPELRQQIAEKTKKLYGADYSAEEEITVTAGATQAIFTAILSTIHSGDEVVIFTPAYDCYEPAVELAGGQAVFFQMQAPEFKINWEDVKKVINRNTRMIIINSPHNPSGSILKKQDLKELEKICLGTNILVLSDEVYEHIIFDGQTHESVCKFPGLAERSFVISSFGKTYHTTGWKIGYCLAPKQLMAEFRKIHQYNVFSVNRPVQKAYSSYLQHENAYTGLSKFYQQKRDLFRDLLRSGRFKALQTQGTYFQLLSYEAISDKPDVEFAKELTKKFKIASIPVSVFYNRKNENKILRFCFAKHEETLRQAAAILNQV
jgi:methionine aminotransferase